MERGIRRRGLIKGNEYIATKICFHTRHVRCQVMEEYGNYNRAVTFSEQKPAQQRFNGNLKNVKFRPSSNSMFGKRALFATRAFINSEGYIIFCGLMARVSQKTLRNNNCEATTK